MDGWIVLGMLIAWVQKLQYWEGSIYAHNAGTRGRHRIDSVVLTEKLLSSRLIPKMQYERNGFDFSHKSGISNETLELGRRCVVVIGGLSANGFQHVMLQTAKQHHLIQSVLFRSWAQTQEPNFIYTANDIQQLKREFPEFDSDEYQHGVPSVSYFISRLILRMESSDEYKKRRMQMIDGLHVSGDHSFKVVRCMWTRGRPFTAVYCLLNEYSQVVGWWMTTGTSMSELEEPLRKLRQRYNIHGYDGPESANTDRCCQVRAMWNNFLGPFDNEPANSPLLQPGVCQIILHVQEAFAVLSIDLSHFPFPTNQPVA